MKKTELTYEDLKHIYQKIMILMKSRNSFLKMFLKLLSITEIQKK